MSAREADMLSAALLCFMVVGVVLVMLIVDGAP